MSKPTLDEILEELMWGECDDERQAIQQAEQQLTQLIADIIGFDDDVHMKINNASDEDLLITLGENANNRLRAEQRQRAKERGIDL